MSRYWTTLLDFLRDVLTKLNKLQSCLQYVLKIDCNGTVSINFGLCHLKDVEKE